MAATGTLTGTYHHPDGTPRSGTVYIEPSVAPIRDATGNVVIAGKVHVDLDSAGSFSVALAATDDTSLDPSGCTFIVRLRGLPPVSGVRILSGQTVDMADITPVDPEAPTYAPWTYGPGIGFTETAPDSGLFVLTTGGGGGTMTETAPGSGLWVFSSGVADSTDEFVTLDATTGHLPAAVEARITALAGSGGGGGGGITWTPDTANPGFYLLAGSGLTADPSHPGFYLIGG